MKNKIMVNKNNRFEGIDGLKAYAIIGIAFMHVLTSDIFIICKMLFK